MEEHDVFDYSKLQGKIKECCGTQCIFAENLGISRTTLSQKLNNVSDFTRNEIYKICNQLHIPLDEIPVYFFTKKVQKNEQHKSA